MRKYCKLAEPIGENIVEAIENYCILTQVGVYNEISPEPSGNPSSSGYISSYTPPLRAQMGMEKNLPGQSQGVRMN